MKRVRVVASIGAFVALTAVTGLLIRSADERDEQPAAHTIGTSSSDLEQSSAPSADDAADPVQRGSPSDSQPIAETKPATSLADKFAAASNYHDFARSILDAARAGHRDEQFYLFRALHSCSTGYRLYFDRRNRRLTLDEAMQQATANATFISEEARDIYEKCHTLMEESARDRFGTAQDWLAAATKAGQPAAQAITAHQLFIRSDVFPPDGTDPQVHAKAARESRDSARRLLGEALKSKDPQALWTIGDMQKFLVGSDSSDDWVWRLAACQRGYDCSDEAPWYKLLCRLDPRGLCQPGEDGIDYIRREAGLNFPTYEQKAKELNAKLDAGAWDQIDLTKGLGG